MPSSSDLTAAPFYLEFAPPAGAEAQVETLYVFRDAGVLSRRGRGLFATDLFDLSVSVLNACDTGPHVSLAPPRPGFVPRRASFCGIVAGLRLSSRPQHMPPAETFDSLASILRRVRVGDDAMPELVTALDGLAEDLSFAAIPQAFSDRTGRRRIRAETDMSRRRLAAIRRFRRLVDELACQTLPLSDLALDAGFYDQPHMSSACRAFADMSPGALRGQAARQPLGHFLQDERLKTRVKHIING